jgi:tetratricopeptide (TPR) repeat protein
MRPRPHPDRPSSLNNLANVLDTRFTQMGQYANLEEAVGLYREALTLFPAPHQERSGSLDNLARILHKQFDQTAELADLEEAIRLHREALELRPLSHPDRSYSLQNLADGLCARFCKTGQLVDLEEAAALDREALELRSAPHPGRSITLHAIANVLKLKFAQTGQLADLEEAVELLHEARALLPIENRRNFFISASLGSVLVDLHFHTKKPEYLNDAMVAFCAAVKCESAPTSQRITAARRWASHADGNHESALEAYQCAINLLPRVATLSLDLQSRQEVLTLYSDGLARNAAACAIRCGHFEMAVEFLEEGRNTFWSQALHLRTPLNKLRGIAPNLAHKLQDVSRALEQGALRCMSGDTSNTSRQRALEQETRDSRLLEEDWLATLEQVRKLDGFRDFLRPKAIGTLQLAASYGPVIILNASESGCCSALIVTSSRGVDHVALPDMTFKGARALALLVKTALSPHPTISALPDAIKETLIQQMRAVPDGSYSHTSTDRHGKRARDIPLETNDTFRYVLAGLWELVVQPVVRFLNLEVSRRFF